MESGRLTFQSIILIEYIPRIVKIEFNSLKDYLNNFSTQSICYEDLAGLIYEQLLVLLKPVFLKVQLIDTVGLKIKITFGGKTNE